MEILNQKELQAEAEEAAARAAATLDKAASDREVARQRLLLRHRRERLQLKQQYLAGTITDRSNLPEHGGDDQPMPNDRHDHVASEWGIPVRGEQKITSRNTQDQFSTAGRLGGA